MSAKNIFLGLITMATLGWTIQSFLTQQRFSSFSPRERLQYLWTQDINTLKSSQILPTGWYGIKNIEYEGGDSTAMKWLKEGLHIPITLNKDGTHRLEILILSFEDTGRIGAIIQYNLVNLTDQNMEWELGRTFYLNNNQNEWTDYIQKFFKKGRALITKRL